MYKSAEQILFELFEKYGAHDEHMRERVRAIAAKYKKFGVKPPTPAEMDDIFKGFDPKAPGSSWQETFLKSQYVQDANSAKARGGTSSWDTRGSQRASGYRSTNPGPGASRSRSYYQTQRNARRAAQAAMGLGVSALRRNIGSGVVAAGLAGLAGLGGYSAYKKTNPDEVDEVEAPKDFNKRRRAGLKSGLVQATSAPYRTIGGLSGMAIGGGGLLRSNLMKQVSHGNPFLSALITLGTLNVTGNIGSNIGRSVGKSVHDKDMDARLNTAITGALETGKENKALNREIKFRLGLRKAAGLLSNAL